MKSIKTKLMITIFAVLIVGLGGLSVLNYTKTKEILIANVEQSIRYNAGSSAREVSLWLDARKAEIAVLAGTEVITDGKKEAYISYLNAELQRNKSYEMFFVADKKGDAPTTSGVVANISDRDYFKRVMATGQLVVSDPVVSKASGKLIVSVAAPINRKGVVDGVMGGTVLVDELSRRVSEIKSGATGYAYLVQGDGLFIAHPNKDMVMKYNPLKDSGAHPNLVDAVTKMTKGEAGLTRYVFENVDKYTGYSPVQGTGWSLAVTAPVAELSSQLASLPVTNSITALIFILVIGIFAGLLISGFTGHLRRVAAGATGIASGDLTVDEIPVKSKDELGQLAGAFNTMLANLKDIAGMLQEKSRTLASSSGELSASAENVTAGASETAATISQVASTAEQVTDSVRHIAGASAESAGYAEEGSRGIQRINDQMEAIKKAAETSGEVIFGLNESAAKISQIVELITQIAEQTNLLALNAAIEAARAGEQGRGFAVVAEEVRKLAEQSAGAAKEIYVLIAAIQQESGKAVQSMKDGSDQVQGGTAVVMEVGGTLEKIITSVRGLAGDIQSVSAAAEQISMAVQNVAASTQQQTATMEEVASTTQSLAGLASEMQELAGRFKLVK